jgi:hypothetical protein
MRMKNWHRNHNGLFLPTKEIQYPWSKERYPSNRYLPSRRCCCGGECSKPTCWSVTFTGISNDTCTGCTVFNKTWYVSYDSVSSSWKCILGAHCSTCGEKTIELTIDDSNITLTFDGITWQKETPSTAAAAYCDPHDLSYVSGSGDCNYSNATCSISPGANEFGICPCPLGCAYHECDEGQVFYEGTTPEYASVDLTVANNSCNLCDQYSGTYTISGGGLLNGNCVWILTISDFHPCYVYGSFRIAISVGGPSANAFNCVNIGDIWAMVSIFVYSSFDYTQGLYCGVITDNGPINGLGLTVDVNKYGSSATQCTYPDTLTITFS